MITARGARPRSAMRLEALLCGENELLQRYTWLAGRCRLVLHALLPASQTGRSRPSSEKDGKTPSAARQKSAQSDGVNVCNRYRPVRQTRAGGVRCFFSIPTCSAGLRFEIEMSNQPHRAHRRKAIEPASRARAEKVGISAGRRIHCVIFKPKGAACSGCG